MSPAAATVSDAMITAPKIHPADSTVAELRRFFADDHVHAALLVAERRLVAVCERGDLHHPDDESDVGREQQRADQFGRLGDRTVDADADLDGVARFLISTRRRRLAVVDPHGRLVGLLCLNRSGTGFCSDADVRSRALRV